MRISLPMDTAKAEGWLPEQKPDGSGVGINYADAMLKPVKLTLEDGRKLAIKRRGLQLTMTLGDHTSTALLRRLEHGPDVRDIFQAAMQELAASVGGSLHVTEGKWELEA